MDAFETKLAVNVVTEVFKSSFKGFISFSKWLKEKEHEIDPLGFAAQEYRTNVESKYNLIKVLGMDQPISLRDIYVRVNLLENVTANVRTSIAQLEQVFDKDRRNVGDVSHTVLGHQLIQQQIFGLSEKYLRRKLPPSEPTRTLKNKYIPLDIFSKLLPITSKQFNKRVKVSPCVRIVVASVFHKIKQGAVS